VLLPGFDELRPRHWSFVWRPIVWAHRATLFKVRTFQPGDSGARDVIERVFYHHFFPLDFLFSHFTHIRFLPSPTLPLSPYGPSKEVEFLDPFFSQHLLFWSPLGWSLFDVPVKGFLFPSDFPRPISSSPQSDSSSFPFAYAARRAHSYCVLFLHFGVSCAPRLRYGFEKFLFFLFVFF